MKSALLSPVLACLALSLLLPHPPLLAAPRKLELPPEPITFPDLPGVQLAKAHCLSCHSSEYITTQPPLPKKAWTASLEKMRLKYGATLPEDALEPLLDYLTRASNPEPR
ncbi:MAG: hypothetical protein RLZZ244_1199 [Verrucomicrobiota bacterium]|jgi:hypothetical protein